MASFFQQIRQADTESPVTLYFNEESIALGSAQFTGKTVSQLYAEYAGSLGDVSRINRYVLNGEAVPSNQVVRAGEVYRATTNSEQKGA
jgi:hypothetical protein